MQYYYSISIRKYRKLGRARTVRNFPRLEIDFSDFFPKTIMQI